MSDHTRTATFAAKLSSTDDMIAVVHVGTDIDDRSIAAVREPLHAAARHHRHLVLDLADVRIITPCGLALLVRVRQQLRQDHDGMLCLAAASRFVLTVLHTMRLQRAFPTFPDTTHAVAWLQGEQTTAAITALGAPPASPLPGRPAPGSTRGQLASGHRASR